MRRRENVPFLLGILRKRNPNTRITLMPSLFLSGLNCQKLPLTTMLRVVVSEPCLGRPFAQVQGHPLGPRQLPQPRQVPPSGSCLGKLVFESLTFQTA